MTPYFSLNQIKFFFNICRAITQLWTYTPHFMLNYLFILFILVSDVHVDI